MKVIAVHAAMPAFEQGLNNISKILRDTFLELGVEIEEVNLAASDIHFFDGIKSQAVENIIMKINAADGIIIESTAVLSMVCGILQTFIEHLGFSVYDNVFYRKKCFFITVSRDGSEKKACDYITSVIADFGGIDVGKITACESDAKVALTDNSIKEAVEKYAEDFYRILKQDRNFIIPTKRFRDSNNDFGVKEINRNVSKATGAVLPAKKIKSSEILKQIDYDSFNARQEEDIQEISKFLTNEYNNEKNFSENNKNFGQVDFRETGFMEGVVPHIKNCHQKTQSLHHYFQPQLSSGIDAVIQINVKGSENFQGYLVIKNGSCEYDDGVHENPDVTVFSDCDVWLDILNGKYSIQKAFMIGQLKVRGNFVLMTKFDQLFKMQK